MKKKTFCLKFKNEDREFLFEDKVFVIEDKKLVTELEKPAYKNVESELVIKSMNDLHISDVIQVKVNLAETGYFLVSFAKETLTEEKRKTLLEEISSLKSKAVQTNSTQLNKSRKLVQILNKYHPIYASFVNNGTYKVDITKVSLEELKFPILVLDKKEKKGRFKLGSKASKNSNESYSPFPLFDTEYLFTCLFALLGSFGIYDSTFEVMNKQSIAIFFGILALAFAFILIIAMRSSIYKKGKLRNPLLRYYLCIFIIIGIAAGTVSGFFVSKYVLKTEIENFDYKKCLYISLAISIVALLSSATTSRLANLIMNKKAEKKTN